jgi:predicted nucleic acid-binding protein
MADAIRGRGAVLDTSVALAMFLPDEKEGGIAKTILRGKTYFIVPELINYEFRNSLWVAVARRRRIKFNQAQDILARFEKLPLIYKDVKLDKAFDLSCENGVAFYDAVFLWLAIKEKAELLTLDVKLKEIYAKCQ